MLTLPRHQNLPLFTALQKVYNCDVYAPIRIDLTALNLPVTSNYINPAFMTLNFRRIRGDITETYKILSGKYDAYVVPFMNNTFRTRGNNMRLQKVRFKYDLCKYWFTNRVVKG